MDITRRTLFEAGAAAGAGLFLAPVITATASAAVPAGVTLFTEQLPTLAQMGVIDATGGGSATIEMVNASHQFHSAMTATPTFAYRGGPVSQNYLGPVIVAKQGVPFNLTMVNSLGTHPLASAIDYGLDGVVAADATAPRASIHLHGGNSSPGNDGDPTDTFVTGASKTYHYGNTQEAAGLWYHDHALGITRLNVFAGLAGGYLVRNGDDPGDGTTGLPPAPFEVPLVIQDRMFNSDGTFLYPPNANPGTSGQPWAPEFFGDVATVNGKAWPNLNVARGKYRFRVYNGSNARFYSLSLKSAGPAGTFFQIGSDGGLLNAPVPLKTLLLGPGERADIVIDFAGLKPGATVLLTNDARAPFPGGPRSVRRGGLPLPQIMQFTVTSAPGWTVPLPATLRAVPITPLAPAARPVAAIRTMTMVENLNTFGSPLMALLNNRNFEAPGATTTVATNTLERWDLVNTTVDAHPIHLHFTQFQVLNRQKFDSAGYLAATYGPQPLAANTGSFPPPPVAAFLRGGPKAPPANERGWKDTVVAMPGEVTRIVVPFGANAGGSATAFQTSFTGPYVWHCHILEHEDNDMMQRYVIA
ncbi:MULTISPECIES: multicopper oxidase family protein [unclassified Arthrobacter]|uniref:multicopper oxidase family protein n=1 Tax=unclassified Arthrobacter TaxID=235627 RepID=UPI002E0A1103|nr:MULTISPECIES: multicopper oxidase domain-containing protein [unclassified Arthrobacter]MEC5189973.1 spore coat protein A [Arthrobacter sp. MP_M4]MEC5201441.1 spore coat protein A [Arthrobacter sp. MP_M7]